MSKNPYRVLGVTEGASFEECTKAYKKLAKEYHPDLNPNDAAADKKMAEINAAYEAIKKSGAKAARNKGNNDYQEATQSDEEKAHLNAAAQLIRNRQFAQALNILSRLENRTAELYCLAALANEGAGRDRQAFVNIQEACAMEPENAEYKKIYNRLVERGADIRPRARSVYYDDYNAPDPSQIKRRK